MVATSGAVDQLHKHVKHSLAAGPRLSRRVMCAGENPDVFLLQIDRRAGWS